MLDCEKYNLGEAAVKAYLENYGYNVVDVSKNPDYWIQDVDFIVIKGQKAEKIEVKLDSQIERTGNFFIELMSDIERGKAGWIDYTKADYIYYVNQQKLECYIFTPSDMRSYLANNRYIVKRCDKDSYKTSSGAIVPITDFSRQYNLDIIALKVPNKT